jgi:uncharacterized protein
MSNRLAQASSAYLRSAAHQPIDWYEFGEEAFAKAKELDKPVLLDIGAVWCHWCHVIDRESYENPEIAQLINEHYIPVKVDRDQRPDIDARYQQVVSSMCGQGGWPLTGFLTHDGRVIYGGTYFPPQAMKNLLMKIKEVYQEKKAEIFSPEQVLSQGRVAQASSSTPLDLQAVETSLESLLDDFLKTMHQSIERAYDKETGGFGSQPKFPHFSGLEFLIASFFQSKEEGSLQIILKTLDEMARGGIYDQLAGGFHRYSVDRYWHVPHFEKMAYDNAEALKVYSQAYGLTRNPAFQETALHTLRWVMTHLSNPIEGGFYASQDADIDLEDDGDHFTWSQKEMEASLSPDEYRVVSLFYDVTVAGDMHDRPGRNVLWVKKTVHQVAASLGILPEVAQQLLNAGKQKLLSKRNQRPEPFIDRTLYTNWNGMMVVGFLEAVQWLDGDSETIQQAKEFALSTLDLMLHRFYTPESGLLHTDGVPGFLEDYAHLLLALLSAYQVTGLQKYWETAEILLSRVFLEFEDVEGGGFYDIGLSPDSSASQPLGLLQFRRKPIEDNPSSSPNATLVQALLLAFQLSGKSVYQEKAKNALYSLVSQHSSYGLYVAALGVSAHRYRFPPLKIECIGNAADPQLLALEKAARSVFYPGKIMGYGQEDNAFPAPEARVCLGTRCLPPVYTPEELIKTLSQLQPNLTPV